MKIITNKLKRFFLYFLLFSFELLNCKSSSQVISIQLRNQPILILGEITDSIGYIRKSRKKKEYIPDKITTSTYRVNYIGPPIKILVSLREQIEGVEVYCSASSSNDLENPKATYRTNVLLKTSPEVIVDKLYKITTNIKFQYTVKAKKNVSQSLKNISISITVVR